MFQHAVPPVALQAGSGCVALYKMVVLSLLVQYAWTMHERLTNAWARAVDARVHWKAPVALVYDEKGLEQLLGRPAWMQHTWHSLGNGHLHVVAPKREQSEMQLLAVAVAPLQMPPLPHGTPAGWAGGEGQVLGKARLQNDVSRHCPSFRKLEKQLALLGWQPEQQMLLVSQHVAPALSWQGLYGDGGEMPQQQLSPEMPASHCSPEELLTM